MAKRYSEEEKRRTVSSYLSSGQSCAAYSRGCGISAITLKSWHAQFGENAPSGFVAISMPSGGGEHGFRLILGEVVLDFDRLPPVEWVCGFLKSMSR